MLRDPCASLAHLAIPIDELQPRSTHRIVSHIEPRNPASARSSDKVSQIQRDIKWGALSRQHGNDTVFRQQMMF
jgi:hypothetical protein